MKQKLDNRNRLLAAGFNPEQIRRLERLANRLHKVHEKLCGTVDRVLEEVNEDRAVFVYANGLQRAVPNPRTRILREIDNIVKALPGAAWRECEDPRCGVPFTIHLANGGVVHMVP